MITKEILIEDLLTEIPESIAYLMNNGIKCMACGDPIWGTLEQAAKAKGFGENEIKRFVDDLNNMAKA